MSSKNGSTPEPDPAELVRSIEATRANLAETVDAIAEKVSPKRVAERTKDRVAAAVRDGAASVKEGAAVLKERVSPTPQEPVPPARPLDGGATTVLPSAAGVPVPPLDLTKGPATGPAQAPAEAPEGGSVAVEGAGAGPDLPVRPEVLGGALAAVLLVLLLLRRRRQKRRKTGLAALLEHAPRR